MAPGTLADMWPPTVRATSPTAAIPAAATAAGGVFGTANVATKTSPAAAMLNRPDRPADVAVANSAVVVRPTRVTGTAAAAAAPTARRHSSVNSQRPAAHPSERPARSVNCSRYRPVSSIGTTASPSVAAPAQSASARTTVAAGAACGLVNAHAAADAPTTTTNPPITARVVTSFVVPPTGFHRR